MSVHRSCLPVVTHFLISVDFLERKRQITMWPCQDSQGESFCTPRGEDAAVANSLKLAHTKHPIILLLSENVMLTLP